MEAESIKKVAGIQTSTEKEKATIQVIERTRILDTIYLRYGLKSADLIYASKLYDLEDDPDVKVIKYANAGLKMKISSER